MSSFLFVAKVTATGGGLSMVDPKLSVYLDCDVKQSSDDQEATRENSSKRERVPGTTYRGMRVC